jgi:hypothetical protein
MPDESDEIREPEEALPAGGRADPGEEDPRLDDNDGFLEVDDRQSEEIREIFGTSFPQYLQPVEEIIEQVLSGKGDTESLEALDGMLASLEAASLQMGFEDVHKLLDHLHKRVSELDCASSDPVPADVREAILGDILELRDLAEKMGGGGPTESHKRQNTIFTALKGKKGIGDLVLRRLSAAGLVTVEQLRMAKPDEIGAVTGLGPDIVQNLLEVLSEEEASAAPPQEPQAVEKAAGMPAEVESLHQQVLGKLRAEVEAESFLEELKTEVRRLRSRVLERRAQLNSLEESLGATKRSLRLLSGRMAERSASIDEIRAKRDALARRCASSEEKMHREEIRIEALSREKRSLREQLAGLGGAVGGLLGSLGKMRRLVARGRLPETE